MYPCCPCCCGTGERFEDGVRVMGHGCRKDAPLGHDEPCPNLPPESKGVYGSGSPAERGRVERSTA